MKTIHSILVLISLTLGYSQVAFANQAVTGRPLSMAANLGGGASVLFKTADVSGSSPPCASSSRGNFTFDHSTARGQTIWKSLLAAHLLGLPITVVGSGVCDYSSDSEGINAIIIAAP